MADKANAGDEELLMTAIVIGTLVGLGFLMWHLFKPQITEGIRQVRLAQISISQQFVPDNYAVQYPDLREPVRMDNFKKFLETAPVEAITTKHIAVSSDMALRELRQPMGILLLLCAALIYLNGPHSRFKKKHTLQSLMERQAEAFPYIKPLLDFDPSKMPARAPGDPVPETLPLFAEALSPEEWIAYNRLPMPDGKLDVEATATALAKQLKGRWQGWEKCPPYMQVLLAAFCLRAVRKREESDKMLGRLSACWNHKSGMNFMKEPKLLGEARAVLRGKSSADMFKVMRQHAYVTTALIRALDYARSQGGVISPGQFIWLRGHDRELWYPLNNLGRQAFHPEAIGAMAHYKLEKLTQRPVPSPKMDGALASLKGYFEAGYARPIPPLAYTKKSEAKNSKQGRKAGIMKPAA